MFSVVTVVTVTVVCVDETVVCVDEKLFQSKKKICFKKTVNTSTFIFHIII